MSEFGNDYDKNYDHNHDGHLDYWEQSEKDYNIEESVQWMQNHSSSNGNGSGGDAEGCCYLILIGIVVFLIIGLIGVIFF